MRIRKQVGSSAQMKLGIVLSYVAIVINMMVQLLYSPVMIQMLGQSEYGLYTLVGSVVNYLSLFSLGFSGAYLRFFARYESSHNADGVAKLNGMFLTVFLVMAAVAFLVGSALANSTEVVFGTGLAPAELKKAEILMRVLVVNISLTFPDSVFNAIITAHERFVFQRLLQIIVNLCNPLICLPLLFCGFDSVAIVCVTTGITIVKLSIHIIYCLQFLKVKFLFCGFDFNLLKEIAAFSFFLFLNSIIDQINWSFDKVILGRVAGTMTVAIYGVAAMINQLYMNFSTAISGVFAPRVNRIVAEGGEDYRENLTEYFIRVGRLQFMVLGLIVSGFVVFGEYFITDIYLTQEYQEVYVVALLLIIPVTIPLIQNLGIEIQRAMNMHQFRSLIYAGMAILNVIISIPLALHLGAVGTAMGTAFTLLMANGLIMNIYYHRVMRIDIIAFWKSIIRLTKGLLIPTIIGAIIMQVGFVHSIYTFIAGVFAYTGIYILSFWFFGMNVEEKEMLRGMLGRITRRNDD